MPAFYAELHLTGSRYRVVHCHYACSQPTGARGRVSAKVRPDLLHLTVDVPDSDELLLWAATPHKPLGGEVVFYSPTQLVALETIAFTAGECVRYAEDFTVGARGDGAYVCHLAIAAPTFELRAGGAPAAAGAAASLQTVAKVASQAQAAAVAATSAPVAAVIPGVAATIAPPEYTFAEFKDTIWGADQVDPAIITQLYQHFTTAKASADPAPHWAAMENLIRSTTYTNAKGNVETLNSGWPPANGGVNKRLVQPAPPDKYDRYQKTVDADALGNPILNGKFTSPVPPGGPYDYEARALEDEEGKYDLQYEIEVLKPLPFAGEEADIIPWHGHEGNGIQTRMLFPPKDPITNDFPWDWKKLEEEEYIRITYKKSPSGKFDISPDGQTAKAKIV